MFVLALQASVPAVKTACGLKCEHIGSDWPVNKNKQTKTKCEKQSATKIPLLLLVVVLSRSLTMFQTSAVCSCVYKMVWWHVSTLVETFVRQWDWSLCSCYFITKLTPNEVLNTNPNSDCVWSQTRLPFWWSINFWFQCAHLPIERKLGADTIDAHMWCLSFYHLLVSWFVGWCSTACLQ